jgi:flavodoxin
MFIIVLGFFWFEMLRSIVVYRSISGFTKRYATWIAEDLKADLYDARDVSIEKLLEYDLIIFGGSLHAVGIKGIKNVKDNIPKLVDKKLVIFAVGASVYKENIPDEIKSRNFSAEEQKALKFFYLRGGFVYDKLDFTNKILMTLFRIKLTLKRNRTPDEKGMLMAYAHPLDCAKKENIREIVEYVHSIS